MFHRLIIAGSGPAGWETDDRTPDQKFKSHARHHSHEVPGCDDKVSPRCRFLLKGNRITERNLSKRELVFGVPAPQDGKGGGWKGLVVWIWHDEPDSPEVQIDMHRSQAFGADSWVVDFIRNVIVRSGWTIVDEATR